jgi:hypothetical protein
MNTAKLQVGEAVKISAKANNEPVYMPYTANTYWLLSSICEKWSMGKWSMGGTHKFYGFGDYNTNAPWTVFLVVMDHETKELQVSDWAHEKKVAEVLKIEDYKGWDEKMGDDEG